MEIVNLELKDYPDFLRVYNMSFPADERRPYTDALHLDTFIKMKGGKFHGLAARDGEVFLGFLTYWTFEKYVYVEHFAVDFPHRGKNVGRTLLRHLLKEVGENVLLEVERPENEESRKRVKFYEQMGFTPREEIDYTQPPYEPALNKVPMLLMTHGKVDLKDWKKEIAPMLKEVYNYNTDAI